MEHQPETWHHGLIARWWAEFNTAKPEELAFYGSVIRKHGEPALDLACGTGRLLRPLLDMGLDVDGCDVSADMLSHCNVEASRLHCQPFHQLNLPRKYRTIFICDSFGIGGSREQDLDGLRRVYQSLEPGGALALSNWLPYGEKLWSLWSGEERKQLPHPWPESGDRRKAADGDEIELRFRFHSFNRLLQNLTMQMRAILWNDDQPIREEEHTLLSCLYFHNEIMLMLELAGFRDIQARPAYSDGPLTDDLASLVYIANK